MQQNEENFAMKLLENQIRRSERHFWGLLVVFLIFIFLSYFTPCQTSIQNEIDGNNDSTITSKVNDNPNNDNSQE